MLKNNKNMYYILKIFINDIGLINIYNFYKKK